MPADQHVGKIEMYVGNATALLCADCYVVVDVTKVITDYVEGLDKSATAFLLKFVIGNYQLRETLVELLLVGVNAKLVLEVQMLDIVFGERSFNDKLWNRLRFAMTQHIAEENTQEVEHRRIVLGHQDKSRLILLAL